VVCSCPMNFQYALGDAHETAPLPPNAPSRPGGERLAGYLATLVDCDATALHLPFSFTKTSVQNVLALVSLRFPCSFRVASGYHRGVTENANGQGPISMVSSELPRRLHFRQGLSLVRPLAVHSSATQLSARMFPSFPRSCLRRIHPIFDLLQLYAGSIGRSRRFLVSAALV